MTKKELQKQIDKLIIELHRVVYMSNFVQTPLEFETVYQKAMDIEKEIRRLQRLQREKYTISGKEICEED